jgi:hypothetical protein
MRYKLTICTFFLFSSIYAQLIPHSGYVEFGTKTGLGENTPFWINANRFGQFSSQKTNLYLKAGIYKSLDSLKKIDYNYGIDLLNRYDKNYQAYFHQIFFGIKFRHTQLYIGKKEEQFGEQDPELSSGNLLWSGNARPVPQIAFSIPEYMPVLKGFIDVKGYISHGWMNDNRYIKNYYLHHKNAYIRLGSKFPISFSYGLEHYAQWGGVSPELGKLPSSFNDFIKVFFAKSGGSGSPLSEELNRLGNHLGSKNFALNIKTKPVSLKLYWQYMFEDASNDHWENISDGLWGIDIQFNKTKFIHKIVLEYINTTNQSGPTLLWNDTIQLGGKDDYFNNSIYKDGWSYYSQTIGTPFITDTGKADTLGIQNNCIKAWHLGISGSISSKTDFRILMSYVRNYGVIIPNLGSYIYSENPVKNNFSVLLESKSTLALKTQLNVSLAFDLGSKYGENLGILFSIRRNL